MELHTGAPLRGGAMRETREFLERMGLRPDERAEYTVNLLEGGEVVATGSREREVLRCIAVDPRYQGEGLAAKVVSELIADAHRAGYRHLFLYTRPCSAGLFREMGFHEVAAVPEAVLLENRRDGAGSYARSLAHPGAPGPVGCIVANGNPFTNGHLYLAEAAARRCGWLYLLILSEERSRFPAADRLRLAREATAHLTNVSVHPTGGYLVSGATFPDYFLKEAAQADRVSCELDLEVFVRHFAPALRIETRFVGTEPHSVVTRAYNERMKDYLPPRGVEVVELTRRELNGEPVSASRVRALLDEGRFDEIQTLVPACTYRYLTQSSG